MGGRGDVLLVEDNLSDAMLAREQLENHAPGWTPHLAVDGRQAIDFLHRRNGFSDAPRPALVLLDLNLPVVDGRAVLRDVRADPHLKAIPIVVFTTSAMAQDVRRLYELGANAYLVKPADLDEYEDTIRSVCSLFLDRAMLPEP